MVLNKYSVINGEVVNRFTGNKARGNFEIRQGKTKISIYKIMPKSGKVKFVGYSGKMLKSVQKRAEKLQQTRIKKAQNKALKEFNEKVRALNEFNRQEQERQRLRTVEEPEQPTVTITEDDKPKDRLSRESVRDISDLKNKGFLTDLGDTPVIISRDAQNMFNFNRILDNLERDGNITLEKIDNILSNDSFPKPPFEIESVQQFTDWLFEQYRDATTKEQRTQLWDMLHSLYPEKGYTYNPLRF